MKKYIAGVVTGLIIALPLGVFAGSGIHDTKIASDTKLVVNGKQVNTDVVYGVLDSAKDGKNYVSARDISEALGYNVSWDGTSKTITVRKGDSVSTNTTVAEPATTSNKYTPPSDIINDSNIILKDSGIYYVYINYIHETACSKGYTANVDKDNLKMSLLKDGKEIISFSWTRPDGVAGCVTYDYYVDNIEPLLK